MQPEKRPRREEDDGCDNGRCDDASCDDAMHGEVRWMYICSFSPPVVFGR